MYYYDCCADCGCLVAHGDMRYLPDDDDDGYCETCYERHARSSTIQHYYFFYGHGSRYLGVELEIDGGGETNEKASQILGVGNDVLEHIYIKHDGSLDGGLEIVTHPMTLDYHWDEMPWREIIQTALSLGYTSHQTGTCGLHVHVNRASLGGFIEEQEETIARLLFLVENFWLELLRFSRRTQKQMDQWAARYGRNFRSSGLQGPAGARSKAAHGQGAGHRR